MTNSDVILTNGAQSSDVFWIPTGATTIGINSDIDGVGPEKTMTDAVKVIPEFDTIAALILIVSIVSIIAISAKSRLGIMPRY